MDNCLKYCDHVEVNINIFVVDHKVLLTLIPFVSSSCFGICDVSTKICIIIITRSTNYSYDYWIYLLPSTPTSYTVLLTV